MMINDLWQETYDLSMQKENDIITLLHMMELK